MKTRKKMIALLLSIMMLFALLAGCGSSGSDTSPSPEKEESQESADNETAPLPDKEAEEKDDRVLNFQMSGDTGTLYPFSASGGFVSLMYAFYEPLWDYSDQGEKEMILATEWNQLSETEYKLTIREGVTFTNGSALTAEDVLFSMELIKDDPRFSIYVAAIDFERTKVTGDYTMDIYYTAYDFKQEVCFAQLHILDKETFDLETLTLVPNGTGPYVVEDYIVNSHCVVKAKEDYWGGAPKIDKINFKIIGETSQIVNEIEVKGIDVATSIPIDEAPYIESLGYVVESSYGRYSDVALFGFDGPLATKEARYAVCYAMDRVSIGSVMYGDLAEIPNYPSSTHTLDYETKYSNLHDTYITGYNVDKAKELADSSGLTGQSLRIITNGSETYNDAATVIQNNLKAIGVDAAITQYDSATYFSVLMDESNYDIALFYYPATSMMFADILAMYPTFVTQGWEGEERDEFGTISQGYLTVADPDKRSEMVVEALKIFLDVTPWYSLCESVSPRAYAPDIQGVRFMLAGNPRYQEIYFEG